jgi:hypothetical protein
MESVQAGMGAGGDPRAAMLASQIGLVRQRAEQEADVYIGYTTATSVRLIWLAGSPLRGARAISVTAAPVILGHEG